jgi:hypothetical protein
VSWVCFAKLTCLVLNSDSDGMDSAFFTALPVDVSYVPEPNLRLRTI